MANYACVAIGINRYQFLPPLNYGQADAQALWQFLVQQGNGASEDYLVLTDHSPLIDRQSTYPNQDNIWRWLDATRQPSPTNGKTSPSKSWRWFFFSGYGVCWQQADYLMPIDGNPQDIPRTGIPMRSLLSSLQPQGDENLLVLLDINRSPGLQAGEPVGAETLELARQMGITLIMSSQLGQFSHEATALRNGLFSAALLEALRYYQTDLTLTNLEQYLRDRLPELSQHHWRPIQTPLIIIPSEATRQQIILPIPLSASVEAKTATPIASTVTSGDQTNGKSAYWDAFTDNGHGTTPSVSKYPVAIPDKQPTHSLIPTDVDDHADSVTALIPTPSFASEDDSPKDQTWKQWLMQGGGLILVLVLMLITLKILNRQTGTSPQIIQPVTETQPTADEETEGSVTQSPVADQTSPAPEASRSPLPPSPGENRGITAASAGKPQEQPLDSPSPSDPESMEANQRILAQAKGRIQPNQASLFSQAIAQAQKIEPGEPLYEEAQQDIQRWSQVILDLAEGRAKQGNFASAIAAAKLVPSTNPSIYNRAQSAIKTWQTQAKQQQQNQGIIQAAKQQLRRNQASSYNQAINTLRKIPVGQPGYAQAQQLINQWSRQIYLIANSRAWRGQLSLAIKTAALVPPDTPSYPAAQQAIARWQKGQR
ncbi:MAG: caspase family protein [Coleofasciculus chthonoplastes F3-SA18-01]|uniref:caspase family protein n=1 Tax=Coleofasciculus chthonoplastes TaxID=64178 RepID=UPI0033034320